MTRPTSSPCGAGPNFPMGYAQTRGAFLLTLPWLVGGALTEASAPLPEEILVTATRYPVAALDLAGNTTRLNQDTIELLNATHIYTLGTQIPGVWLSREAVKNTSRPCAPRAHGPRFLRQLSDSGRWDRHPAHGLLQCERTLRVALGAGRRPGSGAGPGFCPVRVQRSPRHPECHPAPARAEGAGSQWHGGAQQFFSGHAAGEHPGPPEPGQPGGHGFFGGC